MKNTPGKTFREYLLAEVENQSYVKIQYFTDLHEYMTTMAVVKKLIRSDGKEDILLATGEQVPFDHIVRINDEVAPRYKGIIDFTCDC